MNLNENANVRGEVESKREFCLPGLVHCAWNKTESYSNNICGKKRRVKGHDCDRILEERYRGSSASCAMHYPRISREIYTAVQHFSWETHPVPTIPSSRSHPPLVWLFSRSSSAVPALFAATTAAGTDRENHTIRRRGEIDSRCDAGDENAAGKEEARGGIKGRQRGRRKKKRRSSRRVIERCAPLSFAVAKSSRNEWHRNEKSRARIRASTSRGRTTKCLSLKGISRS